MTQRPIYPTNPNDFAQLVELLRLKDASTPNAPASDGWSVSNYTESRTLDAGTATTGQVADFLATLVQDLIDAGYLA